MKLRTIIILIILTSGSQVRGQSVGDTLAWVNEFSKVMGFMSGDHVYYSAQTKLNSSHVLDKRDTATFTAEFYKENNNFYSHTDVEELYKEDSIMVQVNKDRKTIWVSKVQAATREEMKLLPVQEGSAAELVKKNYTISREEVGKGIARITLRPRRSPLNYNTMQTVIMLEYSTLTFLPERLEILITLTEPADEELLAALQEEGIKADGLIRNINGKDYLVRTQQMNTIFSVSGTPKNKVKEMPSYRDVVSFDEYTREYSGKGVYSDYEITKTY